VGEKFMNLKKIIIAAIAVTVFNVIAGMATCGGGFSWVYKLEPTNVWKAMEQVSMPLYLFLTFVADLIFVVVYAFINKGISAPNKFKKGLLYGLIVWLVGLVPGMVSTYTFMTVAPAVIVYWLVWGLIFTPLKGLIASSIYGE
jgi:hypothetical protein